MNCVTIKQIKYAAIKAPYKSQAAIELISWLCSALLDAPDKRSEHEKNKRVVLYLRSEGFSIRKISRLFNYKSPRSIQLLLKENYQ